MRIESRVKGYKERGRCDCLEMNFFLVFFFISHFLFRSHFPFLSVGVPGWRGMVTFSLCAHRLKFDTPHCALTLWGGAVFSFNLRKTIMTYSHFCISHSQSLFILSFLILCLYLTVFMFVNRFVCSSVYLSVSPSFSPLMVTVGLPLFVCPLPMFSVW